MNKELEQLQQDLINELIKECKEQDVDAKQLTDKSKTTSKEHSSTWGTHHNKEEWEKFGMIIADPLRYRAIEAFAREFKTFNCKITIKHIDLKEGKDGDFYFTVDFYKKQLG